MFSIEIYSDHNEPFEFIKWVLANKEEHKQARLDAGSELPNIPGYRNDDGLPLSLLKFYCIIRPEKIKRGKKNPDVNNKDPLYFTINGFPSLNLLLDSRFFPMGEVLCRLENCEYSQEHL